MFTHWLKQLRAAFQSSRPVRREARPKRRRATLLHLERLEDRIVPSVGDLDLGFGGNGKVVTTRMYGTNLDNNIQAVAVQADGKLVAAGYAYNGSNNDFMLARYNLDGSLDVTFGVGGIVLTDFAGKEDLANAVALQADGKIVAAGYTYNGSVNFALARYTTAGALDTTFGSGGKVTTDFAGGTDEAQAVALQTDGKIVAVGYAGNGSIDFALARYTTAGALDTTFGTGGKVTTDFNGYTDYATGVALQSDGKIVAVGQATDSAGNSDFALARYTTAGVLDTTFGASLTGKVTTDFAGNNDQGNAVALQSDGKIVVAGHAYITGNYNFALARYTTAGTLDSAFGVGGKVATGFNSTADAYAVALQADGKIVAAGYAVNGSVDFALARYTTAGALDTTYGTGGKVTTDFSGNTDYVSGVALQADGKIVAAGKAYNASNADFALARYTTAGVLDTAFGAAGTGKVTTDLLLHGNAAINAEAIQSDGKIVAVGTSYDGSSNYDFQLARYNVDGSLDATFGIGGLVLTDFAGSDDEANAVVIQPDGNIVVAGFAFNGSGNGDFALARYTTAGVLDATFGTGGKVTTDFGSGLNDGIYGVALQTDGNIVAAGDSNNGVNNNFALVRYTTAGTLDTTFGSGGMVTTDFAGSYDQGRAVQIQPDGQIVVAGTTINSSPNSDFALARYTTAGALDTSFNGNGKVTTDFNGNYDNAYALLIQADGKIVAGGYAINSLPGGDYALARYTTDGSLDTTYGAAGTGKVVTPFGGPNSGIYAMALQSDGKVVAAGDFNINVNDFSLARYTTSGILDTTFGPNSTGTTSLDFVGGYDQARAVAIDANNKIVVAGYANKPDNIFNGDFALARFTSAGVPDVGFASVPGFGKVTHDFVVHTISAINAVALQSDGKLVTAGYASASGFSDFLIERYNTNGTPDLTFGVAGSVTTDFGSFLGSNHANALVIQSDGKIVVGGYTFSSGNGDFALARYTTAGLLDTTFGTGGMVTTDFAGNYDQISSMAIQSNGRIVVAGYTFNGTNDDFALARYTTAGVLDTSFGNLGKVTTTASTGDDQVTAVAIQTDGNIVAAGSGVNSTSTFFAVVRYTTAGALDTSFGFFGESAVHFNPSTADVPRALVLQTDGKIVVGGYDTIAGSTDFALARFTTAGALDATFGSGGNGKVTTDFGGTYDAINGLAIQSNGNIVAVGYATDGVNDNFALARYTTSGTLDSTFNSIGQVITDFAGTKDLAQAVAIQADGKIVAAGESLTGHTADFALARFTTAGALDTSFGQAGMVTTARITHSNAVSFAVALQTDGKIVAAGWTGANGSYPDFMVERYNADGSLDSTFGTGGMVATDFAGSEDVAHAVAIQPDGKIVVAGYAYTGSTGYDFALARYTTAGVLDTSFNGSGMVTTDFAGTGDGAYAVAIQADGKIVVAGHTYNGISDDFALARYTTAGALDTTFGTGPTPNGKVTTDFAGSLAIAIAKGVALQTDGKIVAAGYTYNGSSTSYDFALARYTTAGALDTSFGAGGKVTTDFAGTEDEANAVAVQSDGKIVAAGYAVNGGIDDFALARYTTAGALDTTFGAAGLGKVITGFAGAYSIASAVALQPDGKIVAAGYDYTASRVDFALAGYTTTGALDTTFGPADTGEVTTDFVGSSGDLAYAVAIQPDHKIVAVGSGTINDTFNFEVARYQGNVPPVATVSLNSSNPQTNDTLTATATTSDADSDPVTLTYVWTVDGTVVQTTANTASLTDTLDLSLAGNGDKGQTITVSVTPNDGFDNGTTVTASATVINTRPVAVADSYSVNENATLTVPAGTGVLLNDTDADLDPLTAVQLTNPTHGTLAFNADGSFTYTPASNYAGADSFTYQASDGTATSTPATVSLTVVPTALVVTAFTPTPTGFTATFNKAFVNGNGNLPIHIYDAASASYGSPDVVVQTGSTTIRGSLIINSTNTGFTFITTNEGNTAATGASNGLLAAGSYTVTFVSGAAAFQDTGGGLLNGNGSSPSNYVTTFTVAALPATTVVVSIPDFARGPDAVDTINVPNNTGNLGIPIALSNGNGVTDANFTLSYNANLLAITGGKTNLASATLTVTTSGAGANALANITFHSPTALANGTVQLGGLTATVPANAPYQSKELLHFTSLSLNNGGITVTNDDAVQLVAFLGDTSGDGNYTGQDATLLSRVAAHADSGFAAYPQLDPLIIGDIDGNGIINNLDGIRLNQFLSGNAVAQIPNYPGPPSVGPTGPDPSLSIPLHLLASPGGTVTVPVNIDDPRPAGSTGLTQATLALQFDPREFTVSSADIHLGSVPASGTGWILQTRIDDATGQLGIILFSAFPIRSSDGGSLVTINFRVQPGAMPGATPISLVAAVNPNGQGVVRTGLDDNHGPLTLHPAVSDAGQVLIVGAMGGSTPAGSLEEPAVNAMAVAAGPAGVDSFVVDTAEPTDSPVPLAEAVVVADENSTEAVDRQENGAADAPSTAAAAHGSVPAGPVLAPANVPAPGPGPVAGVPTFPADVGPSDMAPLANLLVGVPALPLSNRMGQPVVDQAFLAADPVFQQRDADNPADWLLDPSVMQEGLARVLISSNRTTAVVLDRSGTLSGEPQSALPEQGQALLRSGVPDASPEAVHGLWDAATDGGAASSWPALDAYFALTGGADGTLDGTADSDVS